MRFILLIGVLIIFTFDFTHSQLMDTSRHVVSRQKRWLIWNEGVNWVQIKNSKDTIEIENFLLKAEDLCRRSGIRLCLSHNYLTRLTITAANKSNKTPVCKFIFGLGIPLEVKNQAITVGTVMKAFYLMPTNSSVYTRPSIDYVRRKRSSTRWILYEILENYFSRYKSVDGKACLLKAICEVSQTPFDEKSGILAEILHAILTPSSTEDIADNKIDSEYHAAENLGKEVYNCNSVYHECGVNLLQQFTSMLSG